MTDDEIMARALRAYRHHHPNGDQPNPALSGIETYGDRRFTVLRSGKDVLCVCWIGGGRRAVNHIDGPQSRAWPRELR